MTEARIPEAKTPDLDKVTGLHDELLEYGLLPEVDLSHPEVQRALTIAADVISRVDELHGNGRQIIRSPQTGKYATFHHGAHTREVVAGAINHLYLGEQDSPENLAPAILGGAYHDIFQHLGPGENERQSAALAQAELLQLGYGPELTQRVVEAVYGTQVAFLEDGNVVHQGAYEATDPAAIAVAVGDLGTLSKSSGPVRSLTLFSEFNPQVLEGHDEPLTQVQIMEIIDADPGAREKFLNYVGEQSKFFKAVELPLATQGQVEAHNGYLSNNIEFLDSLAAKLQAGELTVPQAYQAAQDFALAA